MTKPRGSRRSDDVLIAAVFIGMFVVAFLLWLSLTGWRLGIIDPMSALGALILAAIVGLGFLVEWFRDWRMLRGLRRYLTKIRAERTHGPDDHGPE